MSVEYFPIDPADKSPEKVAKARKLLINLQTMAALPEDNVAFHIALAENSRIDAEHPEVSSDIREQIKLDQELYE